MQQNETSCKGRGKDCSRDVHYDICIIHSGSDLETSLEHYIRKKSEILHLSCGPMDYHRSNADFTVFNDNLSTIYNSSKVLLLFPCSSSKDRRCRFERLFALHLNVGRDGCRPIIIPVAIGKSTIPKKYQIFQELVVDKSNNWGKKLLEALVEGRPADRCKITEEVALEGMDDINSKVDLEDEDEECEDFNEMETNFDIDCFQLLDQFLATDCSQSYTSENFDIIKALESKLCEALRSASIRDRLEFIRPDRIGGLSWYTGQMGLNNIHKILMQGCGMRVVVNTNTIILKWKSFKQNLMCSTLTLADIVNFGKFVGIHRIALHIDKGTHDEIENSYGKNWPKEFRIFSERLLSRRFKNYDKEHMTYRVIINGIAGDNTKQLMNRSGREFHFQECHPKHDKFQNIDARLRTFRDWPYPDGVTPHTVASAGFIYSGQGDTVSCFSCNQSIYGMYGDNDLSSTLLISHMIWNEDCEYLKSLPFYERLKFDVRSSSVSQNDVSKEIDLSELSNRLATFDEKLPKTRCLEFAKAGFYELPWGTNTLDIGCFHCKVQIQSVRLSTDPWIEHVRWSPNCKFVEDEKGSDFITDAKNIIQLEGEGPDDVHTEIIIETFLMERFQTDENDD